MNVEKRILGVDPGTNILGYGILEFSAGKLQVLTLGVLRLSELSDHALKLKRIYDRLTSIIQEFNPDEFAIEAPFFGKNVQSMLKLGRAQGVAIAAALAHSIPVNEYSPKTVKQVVTGNGNASKEQVANMLERQLPFKKDTQLFDATDGLAVALCHHFQTNSAGIFGSKKNNWADFIKNNPDKLA